MHDKARKIMTDTLRGVGCDWETSSAGDIAVHARRRLSREEVRALYTILPTAPVFTHGKALEQL
jgi:hypothetical protein